MRVYSEFDVDVHTDDGRVLEQTWDRCPEVGSEFFLSDPKRLLQVVEVEDLNSWRYEPRPFAHLRVVAREVWRAA